MKHHFYKLALASALLITGLANVVVPVEAQEANDWNVEIILTGGLTVTEHSTDTFGEVVGLTVLDSAANHRFYRRDSASGTFALINADITGADNPNEATLVHATGTTWLYCGRGNFCWRSTDNGVTWTKGGAAAGTAFEDVEYYAPLSETRILTRTGTTDLFYQTSTNLGATWSSSQRINDNNGAAGSPGSQVVLVQDAVFGKHSASLGSIVVVYFVDASGQGVYSVSSDDETFWDVPFTQEAGSTPLPERNICGNVPHLALTVQDAGTHDALAALAVVAGNDYACAGATTYPASAINGMAIPSATPTNAISVPGSIGGIHAHNRWLSCNPDGSNQCLLGIADLTANQNYVYYSSNGGATWALTYTNSADTQEYALTQTPTRGYFFYRNNAIGGRLEVATSEVFAVQGTQIAVNDLTGYAMDDAGANIIVRTDNGDTVETYGVGDLTSGAISTVSTPDCSTDGTQFDGVAIDRFNDGDSVETFAVYVDCSGDGDSDAFRIRTVDLTTAPTYGCNQATPNVENSGDIVIPENLGEIGLISDLNPSYANGRCVDQNLFDFAAIGFSFSTVGTLAQGGGKIGTVAVVYNSGDDETDTDLEVIDSNPFPQIAQFCGWTNRDTGRDFIGAVAGSGPTKVFEIESSVVFDGIGENPEVDLVPMFSNAGQYGNAGGIACALDSIAILKSTQAFWLNNVDGTESTQSGWPITITDGTTDRGIAMTGSGNFTALVDGDNILVYAKNGTLTGTHTVPTGTWRGMEFDYSGEHLAVFTSDFITVYETGPETCELTDSCAADGNVGAGDPDIPPDTTNGDGDSECTSFLCVDSTTVPDGFTASTFNLFLGVLLMLSIAVGVYMWTKSAVMGVGGLVGGFLISFSFGLIPLWVIVALVIVSVAIIFVKSRGALQGG